MEYNINILDSFPSLNKIPQKNNLFLEFNNKDYFLNKLISQQELIISKKSFTKFHFKIYLLYNSKKVLIGANVITQDSIKFDNNKSYITWLEFRKNNQDNNKLINDVNFLYFDCIRLKIKITLSKIIPKTDKRIKTTKSKIKIGTKTPNMSKKEEAKFKNNNDILDIGNEINDNLDSYRFIDNNYLLKSKSQEENVKINKEGLDNKIVNSKNIIEKYNNLKIKQEETISHEMKNLLIENDCILTDNNLFENYSYSTSLGDNNNKNMAKNKVYFENRITNDIKRDNINNDFVLKNSLGSQNNYKCSNNQDKNNTEINTSFNDENSKNKNIKIMKSKFKSLNKLIKEKNNIQEKKFKKLKTNPIDQSNKTNKSQSIIKEKLYFNSNTYNNFYKKNQINEENNNHLDIKLNNNRKSHIFSNDLLTNKEDEENNNNDIIKIEKEVNNYEYEEYMYIKKDYDLLYTKVFISEIKQDLLDLEFNIALEKSISLFMSYNNHLYLFIKQKNDLINEIKNHTRRIKIMNKKINLLKSIKAKKEMKEKNILLLNEFNNINLKDNYLAQQNIFKNIVNDKKNRKSMLKSIISTLLKKKPNILKNIKSTNSQEKDNINIEKINNKKYIIKSPPRSPKKPKIKSPQPTKQKQQYEFMSEIKNKNSIFTNKLINKKKLLNKNLKKNKSINYLVSSENINEKITEKAPNKENQAYAAKSNLIYYSTVKNKLYNSKIEKGK